MVEIRGQALMLRRVQLSKNNKDSFHKSNIREIMIICLREVSDIGGKTMLQR